MILPQSKMNELMDKLTPYIDSNVAIGELELARIRRDIKMLPEAHERAMLTAFALGASLDVEAAKRAFEDAFYMYPDVVTAINLKTYLKQVSDYPKLLEVVYSMADSYESIDFVRDAVEYSLLLSLDVDKYKYYRVKYMKYLNIEQQKSEAARLDPVLHDMANCLERAGVSSQELSRMSEIVHEVTHLKKLSLVGNQTSVRGGNLTMVVLVEHADPEVLCDANFELAMKMAEDEKVFDKSLTAFFKASIDHDAVIEQKG